MALINDIEGLKGENLASALLAHLLIRSEPVRRAFVDKISVLSNTGPIIVKQQFSVFTEFSTEKKKRVDLLIQTDDAVIGVENKFDANFQAGQPKSYVKLVEDKANGLGEVWTSVFQPMLVVLAPKRREQETNKEIRAQGIERTCVFLAWEELMTLLSRENLHGLPPVDRFLVDELGEHVNAQTGAINLEQLVQHLNNPWQDRGSAVVKQFFGQVIWPLVVDTFTDSSTYGGARSYHGYNLSKGEEDRPWIGFVDEGVVSGSDGVGAVFVVALRNKDAAMALCENTKAREIALDGWDKYCCVAVDYDSNWTERSDWDPMMKAVNNALLQE